MTADVLSFGKAARILRGPAAETERHARIKEQWRDAKMRAFHGMVHTADVGLFGRDALLQMRSPVYADRDLIILPDKPAQTESALDA